MSTTGRQGTLAGAVLSLVAAGLGVATAFGVAISTQEHAAILTFCGALAVVAPLVGALFDHSAKVAAAAPAVIAPSPAAAAQAAALIQDQIDELQRQKEALAK
jgi:hypothetical protein